MKLLFIHANLLTYEVTKAVSDSVAEEIDDDAKTGRMEDGLVAFIAVESDDEADVDLALQRAAEEIRDVAGQVNAERVTLYPYAHLSSDLASPSTATTLLQDLEAELSEDYEVLRSPFGWYKAFELDCKGHPLAELSREIDIEAEPSESEALEAEETAESSWYILNTDGELVPADEFDFTGHADLRKLYEYESEGERGGAGEPAHVESMQRQELVDYEPGSDPGNLRWYPKGQLIKRLLEEHVSGIVEDYGGMRVETPIMYSLDHPALSKYLDRFPARQYRIRSDDKEFFLRFAACFGQYLIGHDATVSHRHLPMRLYELTHYSFRREQSGELTGLKRLRAFTMPDMHTLARDMEQAKDEFVAQFDLARDWMDDLEVPYATAVRFVRDFYDDNREFAKELVDRLGEPVLVEMWDERFFYFVTKFEFNVVDTQDKASALSTVQIDVENTERFDIDYVDEGGDHVHGPLLHASISGSVDRNLYAILEHQARREETGDKPGYPFWLAPTQVRLIPVSEEHAEACDDLADRLPARVDVDDRDESIGRRIRDAETEWVPMTVVYGDKEVTGDTLPVRLRSGDEVDMAEAELIEEIEDRIGDLPFEPLPLPRRLTKRPHFRG